MRNTSWFRTVIRIAPLVVLLIVVVYQRIPILTAPRSAKVISAAELSAFSSCQEAARSFLSNIDAADSAHERTEPLTVKDAQNIARRVLARHRNNWLMDVYEFSMSSSDQIVLSTGEQVDIWWHVTGTRTSHSSNNTSRAWRSEVTIVYLDAMTGDPLLLVEKALVEFEVDGRLLVGFLHPCGATSDVLPPNFFADKFSRTRQGVIWILPLFLLALYCIWWICLYLVRKLRQRKAGTGRNAG